MTLLWLLVLLAFTPWILFAVVAVLLFGAALFAAMRPGARASGYYQWLGIVALAMTSFVDVMLLLGGATS